MNIIFMQYVKQYWKQYWKQILIIFAIITAIFIGFYIYNSNKSVPQATITDTTPNSIAQGQLDLGIFKSIEDAKQVSQAIEQRIAKPADVTFTTNSQKEADTKANVIAKADGADYILKETIVPKIKANANNTNTGVPATANTKTTTTTDTTGITNNYFGIHLEKKNQILVGVTVADKNKYITAGYQNKKTVILVHSKDLENIDGASALYAVKQWK